MVKGRGGGIGMSRPQAKRNVKGGVGRALPIGPPIFE